MNREVINPRYRSNDVSLLYKYYAGFSTEFVTNILLNYPVKNMNILDPWNGSGTTSRVAASLGENYIYGFDINPAMAVISAAEMLEFNEYKEISFNATRHFSNKDIIGDPLESWFTRTSVRNIRNLEMEFRNSLSHKNKSSSNYFILKKNFCFDNSVNNRLLAFYYLILFETVKKISGKFRSSNPTWIKVAKKQDEKIKISQKEFENYFVKELREKTKILKNRPKIISKNINLKVADSRNIPLEDSSIDLIITSPPYCTRIDYTISTRLELAILGISNDSQFEELRKKMIGTTKILSESNQDMLNFSITAQKFIYSVNLHQSKASKTYYRRQYMQYFEGINHSISEINRVSKTNAKVYIVVQDSFYKDIYLDLALVFKEIFENYNWSLLLKKDFEKKNTMVSINKNTKNYRNITKPKETVLVFERSI
ncbi:DNA methyltransferase [Carnobacterium pleistocenium]|uniref:DNA methyltransferase n=1 Tax=Carnobacterium pleistocenium TaxID=181073 RepID=UPI00054FDF91|nr:DNA methyltransferase [Carnobacterium pleistocenium]